MAEVQTEASLGLPSFGFHSFEMVNLHFDLQRSSRLLVGPDVYHMYLLSCLQPTYREIGDEEAPVVGSLEKELYGHPLAGSLIQNEEDLMEFLSIFFIDSIVDRVRDTFSLTRESLLGGEFTKRGLYSSFASTLIFDICHEARMYSEQILTASNISVAGQSFVPENVSEMQEDVDGGGAESSNSNRGGGAQGSNRDLGEGGEGDEGGDEDGVEDSEEGGQAIFSHTPVLDVRIGMWTTPEKKKRMSTSAMKGVRSDIRNRTTSFVSHAVVQNVINSTPGVFDMKTSSDDPVLLYHGTRTEYLPDFQQAGIAPPYVRNELSTGPAFYVTDSIEYAFEHPIHRHTLGNSARKNYVLVFGFRVTLQVLLGFVSPDPDRKEPPFSVKKFLNAEDPEWSPFCLAKLKQIPNRDRYDIVMGPICSPRYDGSGNVHHVVLKTWGAEFSHGWFQQIAFVSLRSHDWLQKHLFCILRESREN